VRLDELPINAPATIIAIGWDSMDEGAARRLRAFGFDEGMSVETLHRGGFVARDPLACRIGRMTVAIRRAHATLIEVEVEAA
jgi:ferrous iron transport protein A